MSVSRCSTSRTFRKKFPGHDYEILNVAHDIRKIEKDTAVWNAILDSVRSADIVLWAFPLYYLLVCSQSKRFIELIFERKAQDAFAGSYAASLSTSIHFFDQTAHAYIHAICDDLGMPYLGFIPRRCGTSCGMKNGRGW